MGEIIKIDEDTLEKICMQSAKILLKTSLPEIPLNPIKVWIDDRMYGIRIKEIDEDWDDCDEEEIDADLFLEEASSEEEFFGEESMSELEKEAEEMENSNVVPPRITGGDPNS